MRSKETRIIIALFAAAGVLTFTLTAFISLKCAVIFIIAFSLTGTALLIYENNRKNKINRLNDYLSSVCSGNYDLDISDNAEGELSVLKNNLYKVVVMLRTCNEELQSEKLFLADSLADISHQLKTPLTSMVMMTDLLKNEQTDGNGARFVGIIENQLQKMGWLISTLLKISKLDAGTAELSANELEIKNIIDESLKPFLIPLELKGIKVAREVGSFSFTGDACWSTEAIQNVIKNCIEHTGSGGTITFTTHKTGIFNELDIADSGCGIDPDDLPHIFERFYHGKNSSSDSVGIGLALSKEIMSKQNVLTEVESEPGRGTVFHFKFYKTIV